VEWAGFSLVDLVLTLAVVVASAAAGLTFLSPLRSSEEILTTEEAEELVEATLQQEQQGRVADPLVEGLVAHWTFDEGTGLVAGDTSGHGHLGMLQHLEGQMWVTNIAPIASPNASALQFDGVDDTVLVDASPLLEDLHPLSLTAWIFPERDPAYLLSKRDEECPGPWRLALDTGEGSLGWFKKTEGGLLQVQSVGGVLSFQEWNHVALTWDGSLSAQEGVHLFVNGAEVPYALQEDGTGDLFSDAGCTLRIGSGADAREPFEGTIDDLRIYARVLSPEEIRTLAGQGGEGGVEEVLQEPAEEIGAGEIGESEEGGERVGVVAEVPLGTATGELTAALLSPPIVEREELHGVPEESREGGVPGGADFPTLEPAKVIDDGELGYTERGSWEVGSLPGGFQGEYRSQGAGDSSSAAWTLVTGSPGRYEIFASWVAAPLHAPTATFRVAEGPRTLGTVEVDQRIAPSDGEYRGQFFKSLGVYELTAPAGVVSVVLSNTRGGVVVADSVLAVPVRSPAPRVVDVTIQGQRWKAPPFSILQDREEGKSLPWINLDEVHITFDQGVEVTEEAFELAGISGGTYRAASFTYDPGTFTVTLQFPTENFVAPLEISTVFYADRLLLRIAGDAGNPSSIRAREGGELLEGGKDVTVAFTVLQGDVNRDGIVDDRDVLASAQAWAQLVPPTVFQDVDGDGDVDGDPGDLREVSVRRGVSLPLASP
jgi:hypothetical protein